MAGKHPANRSPNHEKPAKKKATNKNPVSDMETEKQMDISEPMSQPSQQDRMMQLLEKVSADVSKLDEKLTALDRKYSRIERELRTAENRISSLEDKVEQLTLENSTMVTSLKATQDKLSDLENRERRKNLRVFGFPEDCERDGAVHFLERELPKMLSMPPGSITIERAHRSLNQKPGPGQRPRPFIVNLLRYITKEEILKISREKKELKWGAENHRIMIFQDYSKDIVEKRLKFTNAKRLARNKNLEYFISYPATFKVRVGGQLKAFTSARSAEEFISSC